MNNNSSSQQLPFDTKSIMFALDSTYGNIIALEHLLTNYTEEIDEDDPKYDELDIKMGTFTYETLVEFKDELRIFKNFIKKYKPNDNDSYLSEPQGYSDYYKNTHRKHNHKANKSKNKDDNSTNFIKLQSVGYPDSKLFTNPSVKNKEQNLETYKNLRDCQERRHKNKHRNGRNNRNKNQNNERKTETEAIESNFFDPTGIF